LKEHFEPNLELAENVQTVTELKAQLMRQNEAARGLLQLCRFAVDDAFVDGDYPLKPTDTVAVIPPSSGG